MGNSQNLNDRSLQLLKNLVERYIQSGQPVGSKALAQDFDAKLSPATIRNVMADLWVVQTNILLNFLKMLKLKI